MLKADHETLIEFLRKIVDIEPLVIIFHCFFVLARAFKPGAGPGDQARDLLL